jgi:hypothetical protein
MQNAEPQIYNGVATTRNGYMQMQWARAQMYLVFNTVGLPITFNPGVDSHIKLALCIIGITITLCIPYAIWRGQVWMRFFNGKLAELELLDAENESAPRVNVFSDPAFEDIANRRVSSRYLFIAVSVILTGTWIVETFQNASAILS